MSFINPENYPNYRKFLGKSILAIDYGTQVAGLATYTPGRDPYPLPYGKIENRGDKELCDDIRRVISDEGIDIMVLGLPLFLDGKETEMSKKVVKFKDLLKGEFPKTEIYLQDEGLTTSEAKDRMMNSPQYNFKVDPKKLDALAASIILEDFIKSELTNQPC
jgi:putative Holliday junction resolvase